jgi:hypothetical protein
MAPVLASSLPQRKVIKMMSGEIVDYCECKNKWPFMKNKSYYTEKSLILNVLFSNVENEVLKICFWKPFLSQKQ